MAQKVPHAEAGMHTRKCKGEDEGGHAVSIRSSRKKLPDFLQSINLKYVKLGYHSLMTHLLTLLLVPLLIGVLLEVLRMSPQDLWDVWAHLQYNLASVLLCSAVLVFVATLYIMSRPRPIYLVDYACFKPPPELMVPYSLFMGHSERSGCFDAQSLEFQRKILERSGLGEQTYLPPVMHELPAQPTMSAARAEAEQVMFGALDALFDKTGIKTKDVGILVVNCSLF
eukprot:c16389_g2_i1 orf=1-675(-)